MILDPDLGGTDDLKSDLRDLWRSPEVKFDQNCPKFTDFTRNSNLTHTCSKLSEAKL